jgi:hypothetical protein
MTMKTETDQMILAAEPEVKQPHTPMDLLSLALQHQAGIDVIERLSALQERARDYEAKVSFDEALNRCQARLERVSTDANNPSTKSRYATYAKLDRAVRPIYTSEGFSISFGEKDCPTLGKTRFVAYLSRAGVTREYIKDLTPSTEGPKGGQVMTPIHADASADSYAKRYLLKDIFNIAVGENDNDGNGPGKADPTWVEEQIEEMKRCETLEGLVDAYTSAANYALNEIKDIEAYHAIKNAKESRKKELS